jgi:hypothetical protein
MSSLRVDLLAIQIEILKLLIQCSEKPKVAEYPAIWRGAGETIFRSVGQFSTNPPPPTPWEQFVTGLNELGSKASAAIQGITSASGALVLETKKEVVDAVSHTSSEIAQGVKDIDLSSLTKPGLSLGDRAAALKKEMDRKLAEAIEYTQAHKKELAISGAVAAAIPLGAIFAATYGPGLLFLGQDITSFALFAAQGDVIGATLSLLGTEMSQTAIGSLFSAIGQLKFLSKILPLQTLGKAVSQIGKPVVDKTWQAIKPMWDKIAQPSVEHITSMKAFEPVMTKIGLNPQEVARGAERLITGPSGAVMDEAEAALRKRDAARYLHRVREIVNLERKQSVAISKSMKQRLQDQIDWRKGAIFSEARYGKNLDDVIYADHRHAERALQEKMGMQPSGIKRLFIENPDTKLAREPRALKGMEKRIEKLLGFVKKDEEGLKNLYKKIGEGKEPLPYQYTGEIRRLLKSGKTGKSSETYSIVMRDDKFWSHWKEDFDASFWLGKNSRANHSPELIEKCRMTAESAISDFRGICDQKMQVLIGNFTRRGFVLHSNFFEQGNFFERAYKKTFHELFKTPEGKGGLIPEAIINRFDSYIDLGGCPDRAVVFHELGHIVEKQSGAFNKSMAFRKDRSLLRGTKGMKELGMPTEQAVKSDFLYPYVGKVYPKSFGATEVVSVGAESLATASGVRQNGLFDREHLNYAISVLDGRI